MEQEPIPEEMLKALKDLDLTLEETMKNQPYDQFVIGSACLKYGIGCFRALGVPDDAIQILVDALKDKPNKKLN
jgi:hypothetical protein